MNGIGNTRGAGSKRKTASIRVGAFLLTIACLVMSLFAIGLSVAQATTGYKPYVGIWKMISQDKRIGTLELMNYNGRLTGSITNAHASMDDNGKLVSLDLIPGAAPVVQASISKGMLVMDTEEVNEAIVPWNMTLTGEGKGVLQLAFKGHEMSFQVERISWEENEASAETAR